ncbi:MAG: cation diffusion facilitator family transporter [Actinomycetota bacterium]|nr:cation diffusion facilitator family transporter [Actinomycetota bacterium]
MHRHRAFELPPEKVHSLRKAIRLEWLTIAFFISAVVVIYITLGSSQAMKAAWAEDILALIPPIVFLVATRIRLRNPDKEFPYGYHRAVGIGYLAAALALLTLGIFILYDSVSKLIRFEHPPIGLVQPFGEPVWLGWFMIAALVWTLAPAVVLGRLKMPLAKELHDKVLYADAEMNKADWMTAGAAILGILGIRFGLWWADAVAAIVISLSIVKDGLKNTRAAVIDLMDARPRLVDESGIDPVMSRAETELAKMPWIKEARVRFREEGHVFYGEAFVVPSDDRNLAGRIAEATRTLMELDWRLHDIVISPVTELREPQTQHEEAIEEGP